jgi:single-stranded-DNA-specific exonuclease
VPDADTPHPAFALINPYRTDSSFPFRGMASVGLAFYVMGALRTELRAAGHFNERRVEPDVCSWLDLVALGTVADLVPLSHENRIMTREGLRWLNARKRPGVAALLEMAGVKTSEVVDERTIGWKLGPRLNAPGRLGDAQLALDVLRAPDAYTAQAAARVVETINAERRTAQERVYAEAIALLGDSDPGPVIVVGGRGWQHGVVGIIASRLVDRYQRPALVIAVDPETGEGRGSARSFGGVNLYEALAACKDLLGRFGGHAAAAGLSMDASNIDRLRELFGRAVLAQDREMATDTQCDAELHAEDLDERLARELKTLAPFGKGNEEPLLMSRNVEVKDSRRVGDGSHLKLTLRDKHGRELSAIGFGLGERDPGPGVRIDLAYMPAVTTWAGRQRLELSIKEIWKV